MIRIRGEIPQFKRCCMCLPLRHGLIVWGYIRLVIGVFLLAGLSENFFDLLEMSKTEPGYEVNTVLFGVFVTVGGVDIVLNVVFVYAEHKKDQKMLKAYYIYSFVLWILITILTVYISAYEIYLLSRYPRSLSNVLSDLVYDVLAVLAQIVVHAYVLLLVRSEYMKLTRDYEFRFVNNASESACKMNCEENNMANEDIITDESITTKKDDVPNINAIADGNITAKRNIIANGDKEVNENGTSESIDTMTY